MYIIIPSVFPVHRFGLNPYLELIYQLFKSYVVAISGPMLGPLGLKKASNICFVRFLEVPGDLKRDRIEVPKGH